MMKKENAIKAMKEIIEESEIGLELGDEGSAKWKAKEGSMTSLDWKHIGYISALSLAFNIIPEDLK